MPKTLSKITFSGFFLITSCQAKSCDKAVSSLPDGMTIARSDVQAESYIPRCKDIASSQHDPYRIICEERQIGTLRVAGFARTSIKPPSRVRIDWLKRLAASRAWMLLGLLQMQMKNQKSAIEAMCRGIQELGELSSNHRTLSDNLRFGSRREIDNIETCHHGDITEISHLFASRLDISSHACADSESESVYKATISENRDSLILPALMYIYKTPGAVSVWGMPGGSEWPISLTHSTVVLNSQLPENYNNQVVRAMSTSTSTDDLLVQLINIGATVSRMTPYYDAETR